MASSVSSRAVGYRHGHSLSQVFKRRFKNCTCWRFGGGKDLASLAITWALCNFFWWLQFSKNAVCTLRSTLSYSFWKLYHKRGHWTTGKLSDKHLGYRRSVRVSVRQTTGLHWCRCIYALFWRHKPAVVLQHHRKSAPRSSIVSAEHTSAFGWNKMRSANEQWKVSVHVRLLFTKLQSLWNT